MKQVDVAIIGGGVVGATLALALSKLSDLQVALVEAGPGPCAEVSTEHNTDLSLEARTIGLSYPSVQLFNNLGLSAQNGDFQAQLQAIRQILVSEQGAWPKPILKCDQLDLPALGYVISLKSLQQALNRELNLQQRNQQTLHIYAGTKLESIDFAAEQACLQLSQQPSLRAKLVVGADGTNSTVRSLLKLPTTQNNYDQQALITNVLLSQAHQAASYERFLRSELGSIGLLPTLHSHQMALAWALPSAKARVLADSTQVSDQELIAQFHQAFGYQAGRCLQIGPRRFYPLQKKLALSSWRPHCVLLGNAEHTLHPLSAQGLNLALYDLAVLFDQIIATQSHCSQILGGAEMLAEFAQRKKARNQLITSHVDQLLSTFANPLLPVKLGRRLYLSALAKHTSLQKHYLQKMLGLSGHLPNLLRQHPLQMRSIDHKPWRIQSNSDSRRAHLTGVSHVVGQ